MSELINNILLMCGEPGEKLMQYLARGAMRYHRETTPLSRNLQQHMYCCPRCPISPTTHLSHWGMLWSSAASARRLAISDSITFPTVLNREIGLQAFGCSTSVFFLSGLRRTATCASRKHGENVESARLALVILVGALTDDLLQALEARAGCHLGSRPSGCPHMCSPAVPVPVPPWWRVGRYPLCRVVPWLALGRISRPGVPPCPYG
ncbi:hypothetical protein BGZ61DRAFT_571193 [Ilyonectria robusta]|uniref:uncharacterized protein n=1 Tax=Ilyonectria robusta TaxID=1079257 RepID=UPI001E8DB81E|nr:uncharacterized protein BGZ61DRAFT_571193 [Ilyonectria robusta]KAH8654807.1 hypothetical protein BGZ61DRAFT_571193 [Ilyonectria robusta]